MPRAAAQTRTRAARSAPVRPPALCLDRIVPTGRSLAIGFVLVGAAAALYVAGLKTSVVAVRTVEVNGASAAVLPQIRAALGPLQGESLLRVGSTDVAERLVAIPEVETATIDRAFPHTLKVTITSARRVAVLRQGKAAYVVSERGRVLAAVPRDVNPQLPRVWVPTAVDIAVGGTLGDQRQLSAVRAATAVFRERLGGSLVRTVHAGENQLTYGLRSGIEVRLGDLRQLPLKLSIARRILAQGGVERYVDVSVPSRPVAGTNLQVEG